MIIPVKKFLKNYEVNFMKLWHSKPNFLSLKFGSSSVSSTEGSRLKNGPASALYAGDR